MTTSITDTDLMYVPLAPEQQLVPRPSRWRANLGRLVPRTLSARLVAGVVVLVTVLVVVTGGATYYFLKPFMVDRLDQQVSTLATNPDMVGNILSLGAGQGPSSALGGADIWFAVIGTDGTEVSIVGGLPTSVHEMKLSTAAANALVNHPIRTSLTTTDGQKLVVQSAAPTRTKLTDQATGLPVFVSAVAVVGLSYGNIQDTLHHLLIVELLLGISAVLFAALLTSWGVRAGLRPLKRVTRTAQEVTAELGPDGSGLERRVPGPEDSTEVGQVASSVNRLLQTVQTEFTARVASEERMRQFLAELSRLKGGSNDPDDPLRRIESEGTRMSRLVEDLLVLARGDQDSLTEHEPVLIDSVMTEAANVASSAHPERQITVRASTGSIVIGDHDQLVRLLVNLLNNAAIHTAPGGPIFIEGVTGSTEVGPAVALRVIDSGPGLLPDEAAHVFERFWRADKARSRVKGGSGLGMAIVAQIVESHGGQVRFDSAVETGTTVTVTLPTAPSRGLVAFAGHNSVQNQGWTRQT
jgi:two-component system OmpR family sensor kinase